MNKKVSVGILGSGNIGTDLLIKVLRSNRLTCGLFVGRNLNSPGMKKAKACGVRVSDRSIQAFIDEPHLVDILFDATCAATHKKHAPILADLGISVIDMTPSQVGDLCVPAINQLDCHTSKNINMITCGGQASIPIAYVIKKIYPQANYIEVVSAIASKSAGPGTRANLDEYIMNTEKGLKQIAGFKQAKAILNLNPAEPCIDMQTSIFANLDSCDIEKIKGPLEDMVQSIQHYVPGYKLVVRPVYENNRLMVMIRVKGLGDYLPCYAGNLDIINCAAIAMAEKMVNTR